MYRSNGNDTQMHKATWPSRAAQRRGANAQKGRRASRSGQCRGADQPRTRVRRRPSAQSEYRRDARPVHLVPINARLAESYIAPQRQQRQKVWRLPSADKPRANSLGTIYTLSLVFQNTRKSTRQSKTVAKWKRCRFFYARIKIQRRTAATKTRRGAAGAHI